MKRETLFEYAKKQFHAEPNYLWENLPKYAVLRHHDDGDKWFAIVMNVPGTKLGLKDDKEVDVLDVKARPEYIGSLRKKESILPAYHMNKEHWISIVLSGTLTNEEIFELLTESYHLTSR